MLWGRKLALSDFFHFAVWGFTLCQYPEQVASVICRVRCLLKMSPRRARVEAGCPLMRSAASNTPQGPAGPAAGQLGTRAELSQCHGGLGPLARAVRGLGDLLSPQWPGSWRAGGYCNVMFAVSWQLTQDLAAQAVIVAGTLRVGHYTCNLPGPQFSFCWGK